MVGTLLFMALAFFIIATIFMEEHITVPEQGVLVVSLEGTIVEQKVFDKSPLQAISSGTVRHQTILRDVIKAIDLAAKDDRITMMIIDTNSLESAMPSKLHYIGDAMNRFKKQGKKIYSYGDNYSQNSYFLASFADEIYLNPYGAVLLHGYDSYQNYFKDFLGKIKAEVQLFRVGKYKSAMEPFIRNDMSPEAKEAMLSILNDLWSEYTAKVTMSRTIEKDTFLNRFETVDKDLVALQGDLAALAIEYGLVDGLKTRADWTEYLAAKLNIQSSKLKDKAINYRAYLTANPNEKLTTKDIIAVVYANGTIMDGQQPQGKAGGDTVSRHLQEARLNEKVKAVILRVDSPGGSAFASEVIRQEILLLKEAGKPVVVSMGSLAASGGYWISANADEIWASPTTITGSIGIFGAIPNFEGTLGAIGINSDGVGTTPLTSALVMKPLSEKIQSVFQSSIENGYNRFLNIVAEGRHMTVEQVNDIAQGRVWTGNQAVKIGLVDKLGTFDDALYATASRAALDDYKVVYWEDPIPWDMKLISDIMERQTGIGKLLSAKMATPQSVLADQVIEKLSIFNQFNDPNHAYVLCVSCMEELGDR
ncbi:MAG: signal peptide peptidase SppA [Emcibacter sp.]|nr:signal peptide peptidase SppA [Emcibacter sp.]